MCPGNPSSHSLSSYASWDSLALDSVLPGAMSQHQMLHQLFLRGLRQPPFQQFLRNPQPQLQAYFPGSLSTPPPFFVRRCDMPPASSKPLQKEPQERERTPPDPGVQTVRRERAERARGPPGAGQGGGRSTYRHPDRRDWWQTEASPLRAEVSAGTPPRHHGSQGAT